MSPRMRQSTAARNSQYDPDASRQSGHHELHVKMDALGWADQATDLTAASHLLPGSEAFWLEMGSHCTSNAGTVSLEKPWPESLKP